VEPRRPHGPEDRGREVTRPDADLDTYRALRQALKELSSLTSVTSLAQPISEPKHPLSLASNLGVDLYTFVT
jgi:hypothetical protein